jgi:hypothetical protein
VADAAVVQNIQHLAPEFLGQVLDQRGFLVSPLLQDHGLAIQSWPGSNAPHASSPATLGAKKEARSSVFLGRSSSLMHANSGVKNI